MSDAIAKGGYTAEEHRYAAEVYMRRAVGAVKAYQAVPATRPQAKRRKLRAALERTAQARYHDLMARLLDEMGRDDDHSISQRMRNAVAMKAMGEAGRELGGYAGDQ
jgi:hypothetical protein